VRPKCPIYENEIIAAPSKKLIFNNYEVSGFHCPECEREFNVYREGENIKFTVPKSKL
jgi:hypothetical protein